ncbi:carboxypeptidase-like regulatory domain-containing protein [Snuella lapsa]|uniref:Carboxypeptidase-like regulatory domain-containing protein n=1 Tax=Snuella lapsa TaxID=870481 RepID=A0ABP6WVX9_9FLAO
MNKKPKIIARIKSLPLTLILTCFLASILEIHAQSVKGQVLDYRTKEPIPYSSIYFNNSFTGTASDLKGYFELDISKNYGQDIIVSCIGYETKTISNYIPEKNYTVYLHEQITSLGEVVLTSKPKEDNDRKKILKLFIKEFLGTSRNAKQCIIENTSDIELSYNKESKTLIASSSKPLIILNKALAYKITYYLEDFKKDPKETKYQGYALFEETPPASMRKMLTIKRRRKSAYNGSRMHFFRLLWQNGLSTSNFTVADTKLRYLTRLNDSISLGDKGEKYIQYANTLKLLYKKNDESYLTFKEGTKTLFTATGFFDPKGLLWRGSISKKRIGDLLPYEYEP